MPTAYLLTTNPPSPGTHMAAAPSHTMVLWQSAIEALGELPSRVLKGGVLALDCVVVPVAVTNGEITWWGEDGTIRARAGLVGEAISIAETLGQGGEAAVARLRELGSARLGRHDKRAMQLAWQGYLVVVAALSGVPLLDAPYALMKEFERAHNLLLAELSGDSENVFHQREALLDAAATMLLRRLHAYNPELCGDSGSQVALAVATETVALLDNDQLGNYAWQMVQQGGVPIVYQRWFDDLSHIVAEPLTGFARRFAHVPPRFASRNRSIRARLAGVWQNALNHLRRYGIVSAQR